MTDQQLIAETLATVEKVGGKKNVIMDSQVLTALMNCARYYNFRFPLRLISNKGKSNSLECGSIVHKFLEVYYLCIIQGVKRTDAIGFAMSAAEMYIKGCPHCTDFVPSICDCQSVIVTPGDPEIVGCIKCEGKGKITKPKCGHPVNDYPGVRNTPVETEGYRTGWKWVLTTCEQYCEHYRNDHWVPLEVEVVKSKILYEDDEIRVLWKAKLDLVSDTNQGIFPIDHKTMKQRRSTTSLNNQFMGQCQIMTTRNVIINKVGFQTSLKPEEKFERSPISYTAERLLEWQSEILPYYAKLLLMYHEMDYFPPNFSNCEGKFGPCPMKEEICEANPSMREENLRMHFIVGPEWNPTNEGDE